MTHDELVWGARMAWRNAPRCPARVIWKNLTVFDKRHIDDAEGMFMAIKDRVAMKIFEDFGGALYKEFITIWKPVSTVYYTRPATCINRPLH